MLEMLPDGDGCLFRLTHLGWPKDAWDEPASEWPETFGYFESAWSRVVDRLAAHLAA